MSRIDWSRVLGAGRKAAIALALIAVFFLIADLLAVDHAYVRNAAIQSRRYDEQTYQRAWNACLSTPAELKANCIDEAKEAARRNERDEYHLAAQMMRAWWAKILAIAAIAAAAFSAIGVYLIWAMFGETQKAAIAANYQARLTAAEQRPWLSATTTATSSTSVVDGQISFWIEAQIQNLGKSVATELYVGFGMIARQKPRNMDQALAAAQDDVLRQRAAGEHGPRIVLPRQTLSVTDRIECPADSQGLYQVIVYLEYNADDSNEPRYTWLRFDLFELIGGKHHAVRENAMRDNLVLVPTGIGAAS